MHGDFDSKLQDFKLKMMAQILNVFGCIFKKNHLDWNICNMLSIMFDPCFKNMNTIQDYVSNSTTSEVVKYDTIIVYFLNYYKCIFI
jgi:hypothetical protein